MIQILQSSVQPNNNISRYLLLKKLKLALPAPANTSTVQETRDCMHLCMCVFVHLNNTIEKYNLEIHIYKT